MPRITVEDRRLIISVPFELVQMPSAFMTTEDDTLVVRIPCAQLSHSAKRNMLDALMSNVERVGKKSNLINFHVPACPFSGWSKLRKEMQ